MKNNIIGMMNNMYLVAENCDASLDNLIGKGYIIDASGKVIAGDLPLITLSKDCSWEPVNDNIIIENWKKDVIKSSLIGAAVGDAFGVPYEFLTRSQIENLHIGDKMVGSDTKNDFFSRWNQIIPAGCWSDDTSMIVATMDSILEKKGINYDDIMKKFILWVSKGEYSSLDYAFGLGNTVERALRRYSYGVVPFECGGEKYQDNGNGSLMRILPFSLYCIFTDLNDDDIFKVICDASSLTHSHEISKLGCFMYTIFLKEIINSRNISFAFSKMIYFKYDKYFSDSAIYEYKDIFDPNFRIKASQINETGYIVDTFKNVLFSLLRTNSYEKSIIMSIKLGYDTDTTACIVGSIAGIVYGFDSIPKQWLNCLKKREFLESLAVKYQEFLEKETEKESTNNKIV